MVMSKPWPSEFCSVPALLRSVASAKVRCSARWTNLFFVAEAEALCVPLPMGIPTELSMAPLKGVRNESRTKVLPLFLPKNQHP